MRIMVAVLILGAVCSTATAGSIAILAQQQKARKNAASNDKPSATALENQRQPSDNKIAVIRPVDGTKDNGVTLATPIGLQDFSDRQNENAEKLRNLAQQMRKASEEAQKQQAEPKH